MKISKSFVFGMIVIVVLAFVFYQVYTQIKETGGVQWGNGTSGGDQTATGSGGKLGVGVTIQFADGTSKTVDPSQIQFTLFPLTIYFEGKQVSKITWHCYVQIDWKGEMTSLELRGTMGVQSNTGAAIRKEYMLRTYTASSLPPKNDWFEMWKFSLDAYEIESFLTTSGDYTLICTANVTAKAMFSTGITSEKSASAKANLPIKIEAAGITALLCDIQVQIFN